MPKNIDALANSPFKRIPEEKLLYAFSFLDARSLALLAFVSNLFKRISEDNTLWKALYEKRWGPQNDLSDVFSRKWKNYYERADALPLQLLDANQHSLYWSHGLHLAAIASLNINQKSKWGSAYFPVLGMPIPAALAIQGTEKNLPILGNVIANILVLFDQDIEQAFLHYLENRQLFIKSVPVIGAWLSMLFQARRTTKLVKDQMIYFPRLSKDAKTDRCFLRGTAIAWMERNKPSEALITINCLISMQQRETASRSDYSEQSDLFYKTIYILCAQQNSTQIWERLGDLLSGLPHLNEMASQAYIKALTGEACLSLEERMRLAIKLCKALVVARDSGSYLEVSQQILELPLTIFQQYVESTNKLFDPDSLSSLIEMAVMHKLESYYVPLLREANLSQYQHSLSPKAAPFYSIKITLCELTGNFSEAARSWVMLCKCLSNHPDEEAFDEFKEEIYRQIYHVLDKSQEACKALSTLTTSCKMVQVGVAYALYKQGNIERALQLMVHLAPMVKCRDLQWIQECDKNSFEAALIYSMSLESEEDLDDFFMDMLEDYPKCAGFIYHNLATRLYFEGVFRGALESVDLALEYNCDEAETRVIQGLCYRSSGELEKADEAFKAAEKLNPSYTPNRTYDNQIDLLIFRTEVEL